MSRSTSITSWRNNIPPCEYRLKIDTFIFFPNKVSSASLTHLIMVSFELRVSRTEIRSMKEVRFSVTPISRNAVSAISLFSCTLLFCHQLMKNFCAGSIYLVGLLLRVWWLLSEHVFQQKPFEGME